MRIFFLEIRHCRGPFGSNSNYQQCFYVLMLFQLSYSPSSKVEWNDKDSTFEKNLHN